MSEVIIDSVGDRTVRFRVRVHPNAKRPSVGGVHDGALKMSVSKPPEKGRANQAVIKALAKYLSLRPNQVQITAGESARLKTIVATGISVEEASEIINR